MKKLLGIIILGLLWSNILSIGLLTPNKSLAAVSFWEAHGCKDRADCLKKWCPGEFNDGKKCYKINDFLSQGYEIKNEKHGEYSNVTYTLIKKNFFGSNKMIICKVHINSKSTRCHKP